LGPHVQVISIYRFSDLLSLSASVGISDADFLLCVCSAALYTVEFQKRGLPHAHILVWHELRSRCPCFWH
jgi:hypothetical protein